MPSDQNNKGEVRGGVAHYGLAGMSWRRVLPASYLPNYFWFERQRTTFSPLCCILVGQKCGRQESNSAPDDKTSGLCNLKGRRFLG